MRIPAGGDGDVMRGGGGGGGGGGGASTMSWPIPGPAVPKAEALMLFIRHEEHPGVPAGISRELVGDVLLAGRWRWRCGSCEWRRRGAEAATVLFNQNNQREYPFFPCTCMSSSFNTVCAWHFCFILCAFICRRQSPHLTSFSLHPWPSTSAAMPCLSYRPAPLCTAWLPLQPEHGMLSLQS